MSGLSRIRRRPPKRSLSGATRRVATLSDTWRAWLAENALLGTPRDILIATLVAQGVPAELASQELDALFRSPIFAGARRSARRARRYELLARLERETARSATMPTSVERRVGLPSEEFFDSYYAPGIPVVLTDALAPWPKLRGLTPRVLKARFGDALVEITADRDRDAFADAHYAAHAKTVCLGDFCDRIEQGAATNDVYLIANNRSSELPALAPLLADLAAPHPLLDDDRSGERVLFWLGPEGTLTPLHHDTSNVLFCQIFGRKKVVLYPRFEVVVTDEMRDEVYSAVDPSHAETDGRVELAEAERYDVELSPGEALFIPVGCFHEVRALDPSLSIAFTGFRRPNRFGWYHPGRFA
jgi:Cupin-like domain